MVKTKLNKQKQRNKHTHIQNKKQKQKQTTTTKKRAVHPTAMNTNYFQVPMEHIPKQTISLVIKQTLPYYQTK